jgi:hypothetical protein
MHLVGAPFIGETAREGGEQFRRQCPLSGVKRTCCGPVVMSAFDPKRTFAWTFPTEVPLASCGFDPADLFLAR